MSPRMKGAVIGGVIGGLLSAIPFVNLGNCVCCLWGVLGGFLAAMINIRNNPTPVTKGEGAVTGISAAGVMTAVYLLVGLPLSLLFQSAMMRVIASMINNPQLEQQFAQQSQQPIGQQIVTYAIGVVVFGVFAAGFGALGGLIGAALLEKRTVAPGPPPTA